MALANIKLNILVEQVTLGPNQFKSAIIYKARGRFKGYSWYFQANASSWLLEIAEDMSIEPRELPLVGYACGGWLFETNEKINFSADEHELIVELPLKLAFVFNLFFENKLNYLPAVSCPCSE
ncbi:hypothetical protein [Colwellia echini]|uniref:Uncharacterized protein n=1 Tax=Colwellia echini TaxID=1982103 RepID=A0ABY3N0Z8_9GAMM|nr:hypothetical protein [Colwellia echini]TYK66927.1 hypothetical protein CWS31_003870 [Colwellia echini]